MSISISLNVGPYVILGADCRRWDRYAATGAIAMVDDRNTKIFATQMGLVTGTGYSPLLEAVRDRIDEEQPTAIGGLLAIIHEEQRLTYDDLADLDVPESLQAQTVPRTGWQITYVDARRKTKCAVYHPSMGEGFFPVPEGGGFPFIPGVADEGLQLWNLVVTRLSEEMQFAAPNLTASVAHAARVLRSVIAECATRSDCISPHCQLAMHLGDDRRYISPILFPADAANKFAWKKGLRGPRPLETKVA